MDGRDPGDRPPALQQLHDRLRGEVLTPGTDGFDNARRLWNARIDRRPAAIARCAFTDDIISPRCGAEIEPPVDATAYPHRSDAHHILIEARWSDRMVDLEHERWINEFADRLRPFTTGSMELNFLTGDEEGVRGALGSNLDRVRLVKASWDPDNVFGVHPGLVAPVE